jgi:hypothetical protein
MVGYGLGVDGMGWDGRGGAVVVKGGLLVVVKVWGKEGGVSQG